MHLRSAVLACDTSLPSCEEVIRISMHQSDDGDTGSNRQRRVLGRLSGFGRGGTIRYVHDVGCAVHIEERDLAYSVRRSMNTLGVNLCHRRLVQVN